METSSMETSVQTKRDLLARLHQHRARLRELGVSRLGLFGSFRHERQTPQSDIDLVVAFAPQKKTFSNYMALSFLLEDLFQRPVELLTEESLSPHIGPHILEDAEYVAIRD